MIWLLLVWIIGSVPVGLILGKILRAKRQWQEQTYNAAGEGEVSSGEAGASVH